MTIILICGEIAGIPALRSEPSVYVCLCNGVTERDIRHAAEAGCRSMAELTMRTGCGATCGSCVSMATDLLEQTREAQLKAHDGNMIPFAQVQHAA